MQKRRGGYAQMSWVRAGHPWYNPPIPAAIAIGVCPMRSATAPAPATWLTLDNLLLLFIGLTLVFAEPVINWLAGS